VLARFLSLGVIAFGGPPAHVALLQVQAWRPPLIDDASFASLFALTQCLPGPSSTQLVIALGLLMGGPLGGLCAFFAFAIVAMIVMTALGSLMHASVNLHPSESVMTELRWIQLGLMAAAVSLVAAAALKLSTSLATEPLTQLLNVLAATTTLLLPQKSWLLPLILAVAGLITTLHAKFSKAESKPDGQEVKTVSPAIIPVSIAGGYMFLGAWFAILVTMITTRAALGDDSPWWIEVFEPFYRIGSLIWGGGPVVIPMMLNDLVPEIVTKSEFLQGFAFVQAMPGPNFSVSAFLGGVYNGPLGALVAWVGMFLPGILLIHGVLPFWGALRASKFAQNMLKGVNAAASGLVVAAVFNLFQEMCSIPQQSITLVCFAFHHLFGNMLVGPKLNPPVTVLLGAVLGVPLCFATGRCSCGVST
ncbi:MAG: hypothetical protein SGPRY_009944, partial [Prymnesium sp.]